jgi:hypothetical protein
MSRNFLLKMANQNLKLDVADKIISRMQLDDEVVI